MTSPVSSNSSVLVWFVEDSPVNQKLGKRQIIKSCEEHHLTPEIVMDDNLAAAEGHRAKIQQACDQDRPVLCVFDDSFPPKEGANPEGGNGTILAKEMRKGRHTRIFSYSSTFDENSSEAKVYDKVLGKDLSKLGKVMKDLKDWSM
jgi:hypothetical protein